MANLLYVLDDDATIKRLYKWFTIDYNPQDRLIKDFSLNEKKVSNARRASGFYAIATLGMDMTAMQTWELYGLRDEQEKYFQQMKSQLCGAHRKGKAYHPVCRCSD